MIFILEVGCMGNLVLLHRVMSNDGSCICTINPSTGIYSVMYDSTSIEANAVYVSSPGYWDLPT